MSTIDTDPATKESPVLGQLDDICVETNGTRGSLLRIDGWLLFRAEKIVSLQFGLPGGQLTLASRYYRKDVSELAHTFKGINEAGFRCAIPLPTDIHIVNEVHFNAILENGLTIAGYLPVTREIKTVNASLTFSAISAPQFKGGSFRKLRLAEFDSFLMSDATLDFRPHLLRFEKAISNMSDAVSIVIPLFNQAELTFACLCSLLQCREVPFEILLVDNASSDATNQLLQRVSGISVIRNEVNHHFLRASNQGAEIARGTHLLFLNNDTTVLPHSIQSALACFHEELAVGAVGGKLVTPEGVLQEAGSVVFPDGSAHGYGRGENPEKSDFNFRRRVDFCSGAFLMTPRHLFESLKGFDSAYQPAYYEDVDYCLRLKRSGYDTFYEPNTFVVHFENASSTAEESSRLQLKNRKTLVNRHRYYLQQLSPGHPALQIACRDAAQGKQRTRILIIEDQIPVSKKGSGFPRTQQLLETLTQKDCLITFYPTCVVTESWNEIYAVIPRTVEVIKDGYREKIGTFIHSRANFFDMIIVSRPHNLEALSDLCPELFTGKESVPIIYDAEAIYANRELSKLAIETGTPITNSERTYVLSKELAFTNQCSLILTVSEREALDFHNSKQKNTHTVGHAIHCRKNLPGFKSRSGVLFVGPLYDEETPNADGLRWFLEQIFPVLCELSENRIGFTHVGLCEIDTTSFKNDLIEFVGAVDNLSPYYDRARVFVAPLRFSAGIPLKVIDAVGNGLPVVAHEQLRAQLGWRNGDELLSAADPESFAQLVYTLHTDEQRWEAIQKTALEQVESSYSRDEFDRQVTAMLDLFR